MPETLLKMKRVRVNESQEKVKCPKIKVHSAATLRELRGRQLQCFWSSITVCLRQGSRHLPSWFRLKAFNLEMMTFLCSFLQDRKRNLCHSRHVFLRGGISQQGLLGSPSAQTWQSAMDSLVMCSASSAHAESVLEIRRLLKMTMMLSTKYWPTPQSLEPLLMLLNKTLQVFMF